MEESKAERIDEQVPAQSQSSQPGIESKMDPEPIYNDPSYRGSDKLKGKTAIITGGDSGIGRAVAIAFAKEGANVAIVYLDEEKGDAEKTAAEIEQHGGRALRIVADVSVSANAKTIVDKTIAAFGQIDILVNNAGVQFPQDDFLAISDEQLHKTFQTNLFSMFYLTKAVLPHLDKGAAIINTSSVTAYMGSPGLIDYSATKGAITSFTRSLALNLAEKGIRVNAVAPGPIWTPLIPATFTPEKVEKHGQNVPMKRRGQPAEMAPAYVLLASSDSSYMTGQTIHADGGDFVGS